MPLNPLMHVFFLLCIAALVPAKAACAVVIAGQDSNSLNAAATFTTDSLPSGSALTNRGRERTSWGRRRPPSMVTRATSSAPTASAAPTRRTSARRAWRAPRGWNRTSSSTTATASLLSFGEPQLEANVSADIPTTNWRSLASNVSTLGLSRFLTLTIEVDTNAADENIFIDNISLQGTRTGAGNPVPEPSTVAMGGTALFLLGLGYVRRRRQMTAA